jgi:hypothetical protein
MKFGIVCDVVGKTYLENGITIEGDGINYIFYTNEEGLLEKVRIISEVDDPDKYFFRKTTFPNGGFAATPGFEDHVKDKLILQLQLIEGILGMQGNIKRLYWNRPTFEYYPETTEEHARFDITPAWFFMNEMVPDEPHLVPTGILVRLLGNLSLFEPLNVPMAFYREAKLEYSASRYISTFFNSYFIIEGLFGNGKWKTEAVIKEFSNSTVFTKFVQDYMDEVAANNDLNEGMTKAQLEEELKSRDQPFTAEGLIRLIVKKRGELHHFSIESSQAQGTPLNNSDYKKIALISFILAGNALVHYIGEYEKAAKVP